MAQCLRSASAKFLSTSYLGTGTSVLSKNFETVQFGSGGILSPGLCTLAHSSKQTNWVNTSTLLPHHEDNDVRTRTLSVPRIKAILQSTGTIIDLHSQLLASPVTSSLLLSAPAAPEPKPKLEPNDFVPPKNLNEEKPQNKDLDKKPTTDQLQKVADVLEKTLPKMFVALMDYRIFAEGVEIIDNVRGKTFKGIQSLVTQIALLRICGHFKYAFVTLELVSLHQVPNEGRITCRCRIKGISGLRVMLKFWQYKLWKYKEIMNQHETWHDIIAHFDVDGSSGLITKITLEKVIEDKDQLIDEQKSKKLRLAAKLAGASGAFATPIFVGALNNITGM